MGAISIKRQTGLLISFYTVIIETKSNWRLGSSCIGLGTSWDHFERPGGAVC